MEIFNNTTKVVRDDLEKIIQPGSNGGSSIYQGLSVKKAFMVPSLKFGCVTN